MIPHPLDKDRKYGAYGDKGPSPLAFAGICFKLRKVPWEARFGF
jgi:hypothetical protein